MDEKLQAIPIWGKPSLMLCGKPLDFHTQYSISLDFANGDDKGYITKFRKEGISLDFEIKNHGELPKVFGFNWKTYRSQYIKRCRKPFLLAVTHGLSIHTYYIDEHFDTKFVTIRTPRQVKAFLKKAWHCPDVRIFDRWFIAYKIRKNKVAPIKNVWMDAFKKYEKILNEDIR